MSIENTGKVMFGEYSIGAKSSGAKKDDLKNETPKTVLNAEVKGTDVSPEKVLNTLDIQGAYNRAQVFRSEKKEVNPSDYLSDERIADIEAMMDKFDNGVNSMAESIRAEFPGLSDESAYALAAKIYAAE